MAQAPLTWRYNNPLAVEFKPWMEKHGATLGPNGRYAQFGDPEQGYAIGNTILDTYANKHGLNTVAGIVNRWAPRTVDNNSTDQYVAFVANKLGIDPYAPLTPEQRRPLMEAMASYESGKGPPPGASPVSAASLIDTPGAPPMQTPPQQDQGWLGLLSDRFQSPLFMMGASIFNNAYKPSGNIGAGMMEGMQAANMARRQRTQDERERMLYEQQAAAGPLLQSALQGGKPDIAALVANPATRDFALELYKREQQQSDPLRQAQLNLYTAQARKAEADATRKEDPDAVFRQRERIADQQQMTGDDRKMYIATGELPKRDRGLQATDRKEILEASDNIRAGQGAITALNQALDLSKKAYSGTGAGTFGKVFDAALPWETKGATSTVELQQIVTAQALDNLKATFGAAPTEGERKLLLEIQGSVNMSQAAREAIYNRAIAMAKRRVEYNKAVSNALRDGSFYKPGFQMPEYVDEPAPPTTPTGPERRPADGPAPKNGIRILGVREPGAR